MCGIAGFVGGGSEAALQKMTGALKHRGPDDSGMLLKGGVGLGHRRLSIIDTSARARQPMFLPDESAAIIFNGEIYNFKELREQLQKKGIQFRTTSDTEVLLHLYVLRGEAFLDETIGMFALALYDFKNKKLILARDRMGEKPLYWSLQNNTFVFSSELKALIASQLISKEIDPLSLEQYLFFDYVPTPRSIFKNVQKLEPATLLVFEQGTIRKKTFWHPPRKELVLDETEALRLLDLHLAKSVERQLVSDVPLGVFLSGGIDSSTVAYYAGQASVRPIETFSIAFDEKAFDESAYAARVATHLGTNHHSEHVRADDALALIPQLGGTLCEPMADASIVPTLLLSQFARKSVTVALGGDGGDELFAGYPTFQAERIYDLYRHIPEPLQNMLAAGVNALPASEGNFSFSFNLKKFVAGAYPDPTRRHMEWLGSFSDNARRAILNSDIQENIAGHLEAYLGETEDLSRANQLLYIYMRTYLMDEVLVKVDRASMRYGLETRAPFLDHTLVDFVLSLPYEMKYRRGTTKYLLKKLMADKLPREIVTRKKKGFGIPLARWLKGPLQSLCQELLSPSALRAHGLFNEHEVARLIDEHMRGRRDNRKELWNLMVFQMWYARWMH